MSTTLDAPTTLTSIPQQVLDGCRDRAAGHDATNTFFHEDLAELRDIGYLLAAAPVEEGGWGLDLAQLAAEQRRLARHAPATALALCMHHYWVGMATDLTRLGIDQRMVLDLALAGKLLASGHAEAGNDLPIDLATTVAEPVDGGWRITGRKLFGSLGPVWDVLGIHALAVDAPGGPAILHAFVDREARGVQVAEDTWDALGMRPSQSFDTVLHGVRVPHDRVASIVPLGTRDFFVGALNVWALTLIANVYVGLAERAFELAVAGARTRTSIALERTTMAHNPFVQHQVAEMYLELDAARALLDRLADDWCAGVDHGDDWGPKVLSAKWRAVRTAQLVATRAGDVAGGAAFSRRHELERLYRDARAGGFHAGNDALTHEAIGKTALGIDPSGPRF